MTRSALILAAHGSREDSAVNQCVERHAKRITDLGLFDVATAAFNHGDPSHDVVLSRLAVDEVIVVPWMTSTGYFSDVLLPRELARNERFSRVRVRIVDVINASVAQIQ